MAEVVSVDFAERKVIGIRTYNSPRLNEFTSKAVSQKPNESNKFLEFVRRITKSFPDDDPTPPSAA